jgi:hypothetical protein
MHQAEFEKHVGKANIGPHIAAALDRAKSVHEAATTGEILPALAANSPAAPDRGNRSTPVSDSKHGIYIAGGLLRRVRCIS